MSKRRSSASPAGAMSVRDPKLRAAASIILSRAQYATRAGITFRGQRDLYSALGYARILRPEDYRSRFQRGGIAARVVEAMPKATWRGGCEVLENEDPNLDTEFEEIFVEFTKRIKLWSQIQKADVLAGLGQFSVLLIGAPGPLEEPLPNPLRIDDIKYLAPYSQEDVLVQEIETDTTSERFGLPLFYLIRRLAGQQYLGAAVGTRRIHWTRVIHFADESLDDRVYGHPRLERVWNLLDDLDKVHGGGAEAFWKRADQGMIFDMDPDLEWDSTEVAAVNAAADEFAHGMRRTLATRGMKMQQLGSDVANFTNPVDGLVTLISGATGIPKRILVGSERGELASTQDRENWEQRVSDRRVDFAENTIVRPLVDRLIVHRALPVPVELIVRWPDIEYLNDHEKAEIAVNLSTVNKNIGGVVVTPAEIRDRVLRWEKLEEDQLPNPDGWAPHVPYLAPPSDREPTGSGAQPWAEQPWEPREKPETDPAQIEAPPPQNPPVQQQLSARIAAARRSKGQVREDMRGSLRFHARRALKHAKAAHNHAAVREAAMRGTADVYSAMRPVMRTMSDGLARLAQPIGRTHHHVRGAVRHGLRVQRRRMAEMRAAETTDADQYAIDRVKKLTENLDAEGRGRVQTLADQAFERGWSADTLSRRLEASVGLNDRQATALDNLRARLEDGQPGDVVDFGGRSARIPGDGGTSEWIDRQVSRYSDELLGNRADMIADALLSGAANEGQRAAWDEAIQDGDLPEGTERVWRAGEAACDDCKEMDGETAPIGEEYDGPDGPIDGPQLHPFCDCDEDLFEERHRAASGLRGVLDSIGKFLMGRIA